MEENKNEHKNFLLAVALISVLVASLVIASSFSGRNMRRSISNYDGFKNDSLMISRIQKNDFILPQDAIRSGELAFKVDELESADEKVKEIAKENGGEIYAMDFSYSSNEIRKGLITIKMPVDKFDPVFNALKDAGFEIIKESTKNIEPRNDNPTVSNSALEETKTSQDGQGEAVEVVVNDDKETSQDSPEAQGGSEPQKDIYVLPQIQKQDKGYIKVILADFEQKNVANGFSRSSMKGPGMMVIQSQSPDIANAMIVSLVLKLIVLVVLVSILLYVTFKMLSNYTSHRKTRTKPFEKKATVHIIRKTPKARIVRKKKL